MATRRFTNEYMCAWFEPAHVPSSPSTCRRSHVTSFLYLRQYVDPLAGVVDIDRLFIGAGYTVRAKKVDTIALLVYYKYNIGRNVMTII